MSKIKFGLIVAVIAIVIIVMVILWVTPPAHWWYR